MIEIFKYKDITDDSLSIDMLPVEQHGKNEVMFTCSPHYSPHVHEDYRYGVSVILPMEEVEKIVRVLGMELDVIDYKRRNPGAKVYRFEEIEPRRPIEPPD